MQDIAVKFCAIDYICRQKAAIIIEYRLQRVWWDITTIKNDSACILISLEYLHTLFQDKTIYYLARYLNLLMAANFGNQYANAFY